jgi:hypothetical protein
MKLDRTDGTNSIEDLGDAIVFLIAGMFELVGEFVLVQGVGFQSGNTRSNCGCPPAPGPQERRIVDTFVDGVFPPPLRLDPSGPR